VRTEGQKDRRTARITVYPPFTTFTWRI